MISRMTSQWRRFVRDEAGSVNTISFAIWTPILLLTLATALEVGIYTARATILERGMDLATRDVRINTGSTPSHADLKQTICDNASIIPDCTNNLRLEMMSRDLRAWTAIPSTPDCTDRALDVAPLREFEPGTENELMFLRACAKVEPIFPTTWLTSALYTDTAGDFAIVAVSAFVQEPR